MEFLFFLWYTIFKPKVKFGMSEECVIMLTIEEITNRLKPIFSSHDIQKVVLFGSHAKGQATNGSDVDLVIDSDINGIPFLSLRIKLKDALEREVDLLLRKWIDKDSAIYVNVENEGVLIYEQG